MAPRKALAVDVGDFRLPARRDRIFEQASVLRIDHRRGELRDVPVGSDEMALRRAEAARLRSFHDMRVADAFEIHEFGLAVVVGLGARGLQFAAEPDFTRAQLESEHRDEAEFDDIVTAMSANVFSPWRVNLISCSPRSDPLRRARNSRRPEAGAPLMATGAPELSSPSAFDMISTSARKLPLPSPAPSSASARPGTGRRLCTRARRARSRRDARRGITAPPASARPGTGGAFVPGLAEPGLDEMPGGELLRRPASTRPGTVRRLCTRARRARS